jgi:prolyl-tRNA synthetase
MMPDAGVRFPDVKTVLRGILNWDANAAYATNGGYSMNERGILVPKTDNPPAKVKDSGIINLVKAGKAAYNAKSGELLFLPEGEGALREVKNVLGESLATEGFQKVDCASDEAIFSVAERFAREWHEAARSFCEERGREIRVVSWDADADSSFGRAERAMKSIVSGIGESAFSFVEDVAPGAERTFVLAARCEACDAGARAGFFCESCGSLRFSDSPFNYTPRQPGAKEPEGVPEDIETPGANTIVELCSQLSIDVTRTLKAMLYVASDEDSKRRAVASFVRGDYNVSMNKLARWLERERGLTCLRSADKAELHELVGEVAGYCGPVGMPPHVVMVGDLSLVGSKNTVAGANRPGYHKKYCCHPRDFDPPIADIAQATAGTPCSCGGLYKSSFARELGRLAITDISKAQNGKVKKLSYRDKEGTRDFPFLLDGTVSAERITVARHSGAL